MAISYERAGNRQDQNKALAGLFLGRLGMLQEKREQFYSGLDEEHKRLMNKGMYSIYSDCVRLGRRTEARQILGLPNFELN